MNAGYSTQLLGREKQQRAMQDGFTVSDLHGNQVSVTAPTFLNPLTKFEFDIIWLTIKCTAVKASIEQLKSLVSANTVIICCQNGFGSDQALREALPDTLILNAIVGFNVTERDGGAHLLRSTDGRLVVEAHDRINQVLSKLNSDLMPTQVSQDMLAERWAKLQINLANPVNALADVSTKAMVENSGYRKVIVALMRELLSVTKAMHLTLPKLTAAPAHFLPTLMSAPNWIYLRIAQKTLAIDPSARASMWWDLSQGKATEIDYLNQAVVEQGASLGIDCPANRRIVDLVHFVENGQADIGMSAIDLQKKLGLH